MTLYVGAVSPEHLLVRCSPGEIALDLSTVDGASVEIESPSGAKTYTVAGGGVTLENQSSTRVDLKHPFVAGDVPIRGNYTIRATLLVGATAYRCEPITERAKEY